MEYHNLIQTPWRATLATTSSLRVFYLSHLSSPAADRPIYRAIRCQRVRKILELGIADGRRAMRMIDLAARYHLPEEIQFTGLDLFEDRTSADGPGVTLKMAHRLLKATGARVRLIPGDPFAGLSQVANSLGQVDLIVTSPRIDPRSLARAWFYVPRLLHQRSQVFQGGILPGGEPTLRLLAHSEIDSLAAAAATQRAA